MSEAIPRRPLYRSGPGYQGLPRNGIQNFRDSFPEALETRNFWTLRNGDPTLTDRPSAKTRRLGNCLVRTALGRWGKTNKQTSEVSPMSPGENVTYAPEHSPACHGAGRGPGLRRAEAASAAQAGGGAIPTGLSESEMRPCSGSGFLLPSV